MLDSSLIFLFFVGIVICDNYRAWNIKKENLNQGKIQQKHK